MKLHARLTLFIALAIAPLTATRLCHAAEPPLNIIFDTDMGADCDDVGALFMLHGAIERGEIKLLHQIGVAFLQAASVEDAFLHSAALASTALQSTFASGFACAIAAAGTNPSIAPITIATRAFLIRTSPSMGAPRRSRAF